MLCIYPMQPALSCLEAAHHIADLLVSGRCGGGWRSGCANTAAMLLCNGDGTCLSTGMVFRRQRQEMHVSSMQQMHAHPQLSPDGKLIG